MFCFKENIAILRLSLRFRLSLVKIVIYAFSLIINANHAIAQNISTYSLQTLGRPLERRFNANDQIYARNIWAMRFYQNRLYIGGGNSSNKGPASNAGPVPVMAFNVLTNKWVQEGRVHDEQIDNFVLMDGHLVIPGHDPRESWEMGNFYMRSPEGTWSKHRNIPIGVHTYDMISHGGRWFAALGTAKGGAIAMSLDRGESWQIVLNTSTRVARFMVSNEQLIALPVWPARNEKGRGYALRWVNERWELLGHGEKHQWFNSGDLHVGKSVKVHRAVSVEKGAIYIGAYTHNDHQPRPFGLFAGQLSLNGIWRAEAVPIPVGWEPWDLIEKDQWVYLLLNRRDSLNSQVMVRRSLRNGALRWETQLVMEVPGFARSFEVQNDMIYLGIGSEDKAELGENFPVMHVDTGMILRAKAGKQ